MKKNILSRFVLSCCFCLFAFLSFGQCDSTAKMCGKILGDRFISDGQEYRALLISEEVAEFRNTFYGGSTYRIVAGCGTAPGNIIFRLYDSEKHLLYNSSDFHNSPFWDFKFTSTLECTIEAQLAPTKTGAGKPASGCAVMLIGFKN